MTVNDYAGQTIEGRYRIEKLLGRGGMGAVYLGRHTVIGKKVAVKFLHQQFTHNEEIVKRFYREAQAAAAIAHKNIIDVLDVGVSETREPYLVMEYLEGESLSHLLRRNGNIDLAAACGILEPTLLALAAAHSKGIIHRDLKPENIFLVKQDDDIPQIKIIDFGISKITQLGASGRFTQTGTLLGTPAYMSPEQARGDSGVDHRSDLYSVGVMLYEMLSGKMPITGKNHNAHLMNVITQAPIPPRESNPSFPLVAEPLVLKALSKEPESRHQNAIEFLDELKRLDSWSERETRLGYYASGISEIVFAAGDLGKRESANHHENIVSDVLNKLSSGEIPGITATDTNVATKRYSTRFLLLITGVALVLVIGAALAFTVNHIGVEERAPRLIPLNPKAVSPLPTPLPPETSAAASDIQIRIKGLPEGAAIFYDGNPVKENPFRATKREATTTLKIEANGFEPFHTELIPSRDQEVVIQMTPAAPAQPEAAKRNRSARKTSGSGDEVKASSEETRKGSTFESGRRGTKVVTQWESAPALKNKSNPEKTNGKFQKTKKGTTFGSKFE